MRKYKKKTPKQKLQKECEKIWKEICLLRDKRECQVKKQFPSLPLSHSSILQVDHCVTRANKWFFVAIKNGTTVCSNCNSAKSWNQASVGRLIDDVVIKREGLAFFNYMKRIDSSKNPFVKWNDLNYLETTLATLKATYLKMLDEKKD